MKNVLNFIFYKKCIMCEKKQDKNLCNSCAKNIKIQKVNPYKFINNVPVYSVFYYKNNIKDIYLKYKFQGKKDLSKNFSLFLEKYFTNSFLKEIKNPIFIPVPSHKLKTIKRGYSHNNLILKDFCENLDLDYNFQILKKKKNTKSQFKIPAEKRITNIKNSFYLKKIDIKKSRNIIIFDDIITTGSTLNEITNLFYNNGFKNLYYLTLFTV